MLGKFIFIILIVFMFVNTDQSEASYITKKSDTTKIVEKIEKEYAAGKISKSECTKKKSKALKLGKVSETICDNVEVKIAKKETKEEKKVEYIKKKKKKKKKAKKEFLKKTKELSIKAKSWITKKVKKEKKHYKTIAQLPKSDFYFTATDDKGNIFIGYVVEDPDSKTMKVGNRKFKKISNGQAFQDDGKTQCVLGSEMDEVSKYTKSNYFTGKVIVSCPDKVFIGIWHQTGNEGVGIGKFDDGTVLDFAFSANRNDAVASLNKKKTESKKTKQLVKKEEKNYEAKDTIKPVIKISYNKKWFTSSKDEEVTIESSDNNYVIEGVVSDKGGSTEKIVLRLDRKPIKVNEDGGFSIKRKSIKSEKIWLTAIDAGGNITDFSIAIKISTDDEDWVNDKKYYALIIGNNDYEYWDDLTSPINDVTAIAKILKDKYKFEIRNEFLLKNANRNTIEEAFFKMNEILTEEDYLLIYYAGHGQKNPSIQKAYWIPTNAKESFDRNWISTSFVTEMIGTFKARHVLLMVDSCFSGILKGDDDTISDIEGDSKDPVVLRKWLNRKARLYISSGSNEPVLDTSGDGTHSLFAKKFLDILENNNDNIISRDVYGGIDRFVQARASQRPKYKIIKETGDNEGMFIFSVRN